MPADGSLLRVFFLDVGQGDCTFIVPPNGEGAPILFDCADPYVAERFVANHGITDLAAVVVSHCDLDHVRGILPFLETHFRAGRKVRRLVMFPDRVPKADRNDALRALVGQALAWERQPPHPDFTLKANQRDGDGPLLLAQGRDWRVELVLPWVGAVAQALVGGGPGPNACSAVLRVTRGQTSILVGGDAPLGSWAQLEPELLPARVIRVPHHGGEIRETDQTWTFELLYNKVGAELAVISSGTNNGYGHPLPEHADAAMRSGSCRLLCTQLTPRCHSNPRTLRKEALVAASGVEYPYRHRAALGHPSQRPAGEVPCAGSVAVWLGAEGVLEVAPAPNEDHDRLLRRVDHPMCRPTKWS